MIKRKKYRRIEKAYGSPEFWFVLEQLYRAAGEGRLIGRETILKKARERKLPISQKEIRDLLQKMEQEGIVKVTRGRGGSRITETGQRIWENHDSITN